MLKLHVPLDDVEPVEHEVRECLLCGCRFTFYRWVDNDDLVI